MTGLSRLSSLSRPRAAAALLGVLTLLGALLFVGANLAGSQEGLVFPLDDAYIHLQYARQLAAGHLWQYSPDAAPSTGATSLLFVVLLVPFFWFSPSLPALVAIEFTLSAIFLFLTALGVYTLVRFLAGLLALPGQEPLALLAGALVPLNGAALWLAFSGMETLLFVAAIVWSFVAFLYRRHTGLGVLLVLLVLIRPEGLLLVPLFIGADLLLGGWRAALRGCYLLPLVAAGLSYLLNDALTGHASANGLVAKSWLYSVPFYPRGVVETVLRYWGRLLVAHLNGGTNGDIRLTPPLMLAWGACGLYALLRQPARMGRVVALVFGAWLLGAALMVATLSTAFWHYGRYELPLVVVTSSLGVLGAAALLARLRRARAVLGGVLAAIAIIWSLLSIADAWMRYALATHTLRHQQYVLAEWVEANVPPEATIAVHDVGALAFLGAHTTFDLIGLTGGSPYAYRDGPGATYELLESLPPATRPQFFASYEEAPPIMVYLGQTQLLNDRLFTVELDEYSSFVSAHAAQSVYAADWSLAGSGDHPYQADVLGQTRYLQEVDRLDVADLAAEDAHHYHWWLRGEPQGFASEVRQFGYRANAEWQVIDGGRVLNGGETFRIATQPGQDLLIVARVNAITAGDVRVSVDGQDAGEWRYPAIPGEWQEVSIWISGGYITGESTELRFEAADDTQHAPYYYWFYQGQRSAVPSPEPGHPVNVQFGSVVRLLGYDLAADSTQVELDLVWEALSASPVPLKVFVHLCAADGEIVAQDDQEPHNGLKPATLWQAGERFGDTYTLSLPADLAPGDYALWVGLYDPQTGQRLEASAGDRESDAWLIQTIHYEDAP